MKEYDFSNLWGQSSVAPSFGIMRSMKTLVPGDAPRERPHFYTPVYVLWDAIEAVRSLSPTATKETLVPILFTDEVDVAMAAITGAHRDEVDPRSHFPGPEASFYAIVKAMRDTLIADSKREP